MWVGSTNRSRWWTAKSFESMLEEHAKANSRRPAKDSVDSKDLNAFIRICRHVVILLLSGDEFAGVDSMAKLADYFRSRKYAVLRNSGPSTAKPESPNATAFDVESSRSSE